MPLSTARFTSPHVDTARNQGSSFAACTDPQVRGVLWSGEFRHWQICSRYVRVFNAETFQDFLKKFLRHRSRGKRMVIVLDNARCHHAILLAPLLRKYRSVLRLLFLPPYSPQLAPIERVWKLARRLATHNRYFATLTEVLDAIENCFNRWRKPNPVLRRICGII